MERNEFKNKVYSNNKSILSQCKLILNNNILAIENHEKDFDKAIYSFKKNLKWRIQNFIHFNKSVFDNYKHRAFFDDLFVSYALYCFKYKWDYCCLSSDTTEFNIDSVFTYMRLFANNAKVLEKRLEDDKIYVNSTDLPNFRFWSDRVKNEGNYIYEIERLSKYISFVLDMSYAELKTVKSHWSNSIDNNDFLFKVNNIIDNYQCALEDCFNDDYYLYNKKECKNKHKEKKEALKFLKDNGIPDIYNRLNSSVHKQEAVKRKLSVLIQHHLSRVAHPEDNLRRRNMLIFGPSGSGKTQLMRAVKNYVPVQVLCIDMSQISPEGWKGATFSSVFGEIKNSLQDGQTIDNAIIFLDEFDKIFGLSDYSTDANYRKDMQANLLKILEDGEVRNESGKKICDCSNCTFVLTGAFPDLLKDDDVVVSSICDKNKLGSTNRAQINERLLKFGMLTELLGRIGDIEQVYELSVSDYKYIINNMDNSVIKSAIKEMNLLGKKLYIDDDAIELVAKYAKESGLGVRGADTIFQEIIDDMKFDMAKSNKKSGRLTKNRVKKYLE